MIIGVTLAPAIDRTARVEQLAFDEILRPSEVRVLPGGKGVNACRAALRLGARVATTGICGGHAGAWLVEALAAEGLDPHFVVAGPETRSTYVATDASGRSMLIYEPGCELAPAALDQLLDLLRSELLSSGDWLICSGSMPAGLPADAYAQLVRVAHDRGAQCLVDTGGGALRLALEAGPDVVKVTLAEARAAGLAQGSSFAGAGASAVQLAGHGARLAVVTDGANGAAAADETRAWTVRVPRLRARNAVGAGDVFNAGLIVALAADSPVEVALAAAGAAASASVLELGAGEVDPARAAELRAKVVVREVRSGAR